MKAKLFSATHAVAVEVADLRREPVEAKRGYEKDPLQDSQLLFGEKVTVLEEKGEWVRIEAIEQKKHSQNGSWMGYPGWVKSSQLHQITEKLNESSNLVVIKTWAKVTPFNKIPFQVSFGTTFYGSEEKNSNWIIHFSNGQKGTIACSDVSIIPSSASRQEIIKLARLFLGYPYLWGGRCAFDSEIQHVNTSVDCSGYINLLYQTQGVNIPRDAHDQYLFSKKIEMDQLQQGDLVFMAPINKPERMNHVMLYAGNGILLESTMASKNVREISLKERMQNPDYLFHFGSLL